MLDAIAVRRRRRRSTALQVVASNIVPEGTAVPRSSLPFRPYFHTAVSKLRKRVGRCASWSIRKPSHNGLWRNGSETALHGITEITQDPGLDRIAQRTSVSKTIAHCAQLKNRNIFVPTWGENASSLGTSALFLYYSIAKYYCVVCFGLSCNINYT